MAPSLHDLRRRTMARLRGDYASLDGRKRALLRVLLRDVPVVRDAVARGEADEDTAVTAVERLIETGAVRFTIEERGGLIHMGVVTAPRH